MKKQGTKKSRYLVCEKCQTHICPKCQLQSHDGKPCALKGDTKFRLWASRGIGVKNCPVCNARTQKNEGCNHMHCQRCQTDWCWICNQVANELHYELEFKNLFKGCPGLQFKLDNGWLLAHVLFLIFIFCSVIYFTAPILGAFFGGFTPLVLQR